jgi:hypothetical protein
VAVVVQKAESKWKNKVEGDDWCLGWLTTIHIAGTGVVVISLRLWGNLGDGFAKWETVAQPKSC